MPRPFMIGFAAHGQSSWESPKEFRDWLRLQPPERIFQTNDFSHCPLASFFQDTDNNPERIYCYNPSCINEDSPWRVKFGVKVDSEPTPIITAQRALEILNEVAPE